MIQLAIPNIKNPVINPQEGDIASFGSNVLGNFIARLWQAVVIIGGLALLIFLIWGAFDWLISEGNQEKLNAARRKIEHALLGLALLATSFVIVKVIEQIFGFDILNVAWPTP